MGMRGMRLRRRGSRVVLVMMAVGLIWGPAAEAGMRQTTVQFQEKSDLYNAEEFPWQAVAEANQRGVEFQAPGPTPPVTRDKTTVKLTLETEYGEADDAEARGYEANFEASYVIRNKKEAPKVEGQTAEQKAAAEKATFVIFFPFPGDADTIDDVKVTVRDMDTPDSPAKDVPDAVYRQAGVSFETTFLSKQTKEISVSYRASGTEDFVFALDHDEQIKELDFQLTVPSARNVPDLEHPSCLKPTTELTRTDAGYTAAWNYTNLVTTNDIYVVIPEPFLGGNVSQRMSAVVRATIGAMVLFGLLLAAGAVIRRRAIGLGQAFLIFVAMVIYPSLALYLSKHISPAWAFIIAFVVTGILVMAVLRRSHGMRFAIAYGGLGLIVTLGMLSTASVLTSGSGLLTTASLILLLGFAIYAAPRLSEALVEHQERTRAQRAEWAAVPVAEEAIVDDPADEPVATVAAEQAPEEFVAPPTGDWFCAHCGREVSREFRYCPHCSEESQVTVQCAACGADICRACGKQYAYCPSCGAGIQHAET